MDKLNINELLNRENEENIFKENLNFFDKIRNLAQRYSKSTELRKFNGNRGSKHFIYINRTFFGLYNLMFDLKASAVKINQFNNY